MSWVPESDISWIQKLFARVVKAGPVPKHVAFIMDGNRRFARKLGIQRAEGHLEGFNMLTRTLGWCLELGITEVTVYAFSIENFKRSKEEVNGLLELARQKFKKLLDEKELIEKNQVCVRILGNLNMLPKDLQKLAAEVMNCSKHNTRATLNVCFAYTSRDELCHAMTECAEGVELGIINESDIDEDVLQQCLYTSKSQDPDLLVRTSGEVRLSDFLLWQTSYSVLSFVPVLWPEFSIWHLYAAVINYQRNYASIQNAKNDHKTRVRHKRLEEDHNLVLKQVSEKLTEEEIQEKRRLFTKNREQRLHEFKMHLSRKHDRFLSGLL